jgi:hypothetical protein
MVDNASSHVQQSVTLFHGLLNEQLARVEAFGTEVGKAQEQGMAQAKLAADESTKVFQAFMEFGTQLTRDFQKLAFDGARRGLELLRPQG